MNNNSSVDYKITKKKLKEIKKNIALIVNIFMFVDM